MTQEQSELIRKQEEKDRNIIEKYVLHNYLHITNPAHIHFTKDIYDKRDVFFTATTHNNGEEVYTSYVGEIKERTYPLTFFKSRNWMIELSKLQALFATYEDTGHIPLYFNIFQNNMIFIWNLNKIDFDLIPYREMLLKGTTSYLTNNKDKHYYDLPTIYYEDGTEISGITALKYTKDETNIVIKK
ncbi:hypothetical protein EZS27_004670 [termite gut metagenome]|uniref:Uncharacterized protein n=1 Tax=termite gut metagenome TaxID=433724 RepID=A0A5J4SRG4_9ZZZZ